MDHHIALINQIFDIRQKLRKELFYEKYERGFSRLENIFEEQGFVVLNPEGERYSDSRTDCEANIVGRESSHMLIRQVIKPVVYQKIQGTLVLVQKGIVIVEAQ